MNKKVQKLIDKLGGPQNCVLIIQGFINGEASYTMDSPESELIAYYLHYVEDDYSDDAIRKFIGKNLFNIN